MDAFIGEIRPFAFNFVPDGWLACNGGQLSTSAYSHLFSVIGNYYGGDGINNFNLPNLNGQIAVGSGQLSGGQLYPIGSKGGSENVALNNSQMPAHNHTVQGAVTTGQIPKLTKNPSTDTYLSNIVSQSDNKLGFMYGVDSTPSNDIPLNNQTITLVGGNSPHSNMAPFLPLNYCICNQGTYPARPN